MNCPSESDFSVRSGASGVITRTARLASDVVLTVTSGDTGEATVAPATLTFTTANWNSPQTVTVTGVDDAVVDGPVAYTIVTASATSTDPSYNGLDPAEVADPGTTGQVMQFRVVLADGRLLCTYGQRSGRHNDPAGIRATFSADFRVFSPKLPPQHQSHGNPQSEHQLR